MALQCRIAFALTLAGLDHSLDRLDGGVGSDIKGKSVATKRLNENLHGK